MLLEIVGAVIINSASGWSSRTEVETWDDLSTETSEGKVAQVEYFFVRAVIVFVIRSGRWRLPATS